MKNENNLNEEQRNELIQVKKVSPALITIIHELLSRSTGRGVYFYDSDGFMIEIRCKPE